ncbi:hypothetical protein FLAG1_07932 [Fusarium langsethiae]|uniref:Uncharacterized protein n=1 Tax=Fusarium langsethiae TaxID=179993 RepID=A0A0M9ET14_FUSLA|nr:hypothetical protein FLAG1_07932 [Fusarium langsethiae]GKU05545.1 unnamed protein product [Fusarium langsethiae]GKU20028.1 unnamed protein product [Fusarium langsethiae]
MTSINRTGESQGRQDNGRSISATLPLKVHVHVNPQYEQTLMRWKVEVQAKESVEMDQEQQSLAGRLESLTLTEIRAAEEEKRAAEAHLKAIDTKIRYLRSVAEELVLRAELHEAETGKKDNE